MIKMELAKIIISETNEEQIIVLKETNGSRSFPIVIGIYEAAAIDRKIKNIKTPRPLTHDLIGNILSGLKCRLQRVVVSDIKNHTFYAKLLVKLNGDPSKEGRPASPAGGSVEIDSRPSDAIVLAIQMNVPIYVAEKVLDDVVGNNPGIV